MVRFNDINDEEASEFRDKLSITFKNGSIDDYIGIRLGFRE